MISFETLALVRLVKTAVGLSDHDQRKLKESNLCQEIMSYTLQGAAEPAAHFPEINRRTCTCRASGHTTRAQPSPATPLGPTRNTHLYTRIYCPFVCLPESMCLCMYLCTYVCAYIHEYINICVYACRHVNIHRQILSHII